MGKVEMQRKYKINPNTCNKKYICVWEWGDGGKMNSSQLLTKDYKIVAFIYG